MSNFFFFARMMLHGVAAPAMESVVLGEEGVVVVEVVRRQVWSGVAAAVVG